MPATDIDPTSYLPEFSGNSYIFVEQTSATVEEMINSLESKTSKDIYNFSTSLIKFVSKELSAPLCHIFNLSTKTGVFPKSYKISRVVPIHKAGPTDDLNNYRPISCLPTFSKILERIVAKQLVSFLNENSLIYKYQFGFQSKHSTLHPLMHITKFITEAMNNNEFAVALYLDLQKAFDLINHDILIQKLSKIGIKGVYLDWFISYLNNRKQTVMVNGVLSDSFCNILMSVLQGSTLGPILFICFINDMPLSNLLFNILFADDTTGLIKGPNLQILSDQLNLELQKLGMWLRSNKLAINATKTKIMIFHPKNAVIPNVNFYFNNNDIGAVENPDLIFKLERIHNNSGVPAYKVLGVHFDENLNFDYHVSKIVTKLSKSLFFLRNAKHVLSQKGLKTLYYALIHPYLLYCLPVYSCTSAKNIKILFSKQKQAIRIISHAKYNAHTQPLFLAQGILPLPDLIEQQRLLFVYSFEKNLLPRSFSDYFIRNNDRALPYNIRNATDLFIPHIRTEFLKRFPFYSFPSSWNNLPEAVRTIQTLSLFKTTVKKHLLTKLEGFTCNRLLCHSCLPPNHSR